MGKYLGILILFIPYFIVSSLYAQCLQNSIHLTGTQVNHLNSAPQTLISSPGIGKIIIPKTALIKYTNGNIENSGGSGLFESVYNLMLDTIPFPFSDGSSVTFNLARSTDLSGNYIGFTGDLIYKNFLPMGNSVHTATTLLNAVNQPLILISSSDNIGNQGINKTSITLNNGGAGYSALDTCTIPIGNLNATLTIDTVDGGGVVQTFHLTSSGSAYSTGTGIATTCGTGDGNFTIDIGVVGDQDGTIDILLTYEVLTVP